MTSELRNPTTPPPFRPQVYDTADYFASLVANYDNRPIVGNSYVSCGVTMLAGLHNSSPSQIVDKVLKERNPTDVKKIREAFVMFSDTDNGALMGGNALYSYIRENNLGNIVEFGPRMNPNTGNMIKLWIWEPPHKSLDPKHRNMDVYGMEKVRTNYGIEYVNANDERLKDGRFERLPRGL
jgi:hypothetical protein